MSDGPADELTPAQQRVRTLLRPLRDQQAPHGAQLVAAVGRSARWQRPVRRALVAVGHAAAGLVSGLGGRARGSRR